MILPSISFFQPAKETLMVPVSEMMIEQANNKISKKETLFAYKRVWKKSGYIPGVDGDTISQIEPRRRSFLDEIRFGMNSGLSFQSAYIKHENKRSGRECDLPTIRGRVADYSFCPRLAAFDGLIHDSAVGFRIGIGMPQIVERIRQATRYYRFVITFDIKDAYPSISNALLVAGIEKLPLDTILGKYLQNVLNNPDRNGLPIGMPTSPFLFNISLHTIDERVAQVAPFYIRYADNVLMCFDDADEAERGLSAAIEITRSNGFQVHEIQQSDCTNGVEFIGHVIQENDLWPTPKAVERSMKRIKSKQMWLDHYLRLGARIDTLARLYPAMVENMRSMEKYILPTALSYDPSMYSVLSVRSHGPAKELPCRVSGGRLNRNQPPSSPPDLHQERRVKERLEQGARFWQYYFACEDIDEFRGLLSTDLFQNEGWNLSEDKVFQFMRGLLLVGIYWDDRNTDWIPPMRVLRAAYSKRFPTFSEIFHVFDKIRLNNLSKKDAEREIRFKLRSRPVKGKMWYEDPYWLEYISKLKKVFEDIEDEQNALKKGENHMSNEKLFVEFQAVRKQFFPRWDKQRLWQIILGFPPDSDPSGSRCFLNKKEIWIDPDKVLIGGDELQREIIHEIAHAVTNTIGHTTSWKRRMEIAAKNAKKLGRDNLEGLLLSDAKKRNMWKGSLCSEIYTWTNDQVEELESFEEVVSAVQKHFSVGQTTLKERCKKLEEVYRKARKRYLQEKERNEKLIKALKGLI